MNRELKTKIDDCEKELNDIKKFASDNPVDSKVHYLTKYAIVRLSGTVEYIIKQIIYEYLSYNAIDETKEFLNNKIVLSSTNPNTGNVKRIIQDFNPTKAESLDNCFKNKSDIKQDVNSLVQLRNNISHGSDNTTTINTVLRYFESCKSYINEIERIVIS